MLTRTIRLRSPIDPVATLGPFVRGRSDPTARLERNDFWRAGRSPAGPYTIHLRFGNGEVLVGAWGSGAVWALDRVPGLIGLTDRPESFRPPAGLIRELHRRRPGLRIGRTGDAFEALVPSILEQRVASVEAHRSFRELVRRYGHPAPGPLDLMVQPDPDTLAAIPSYDLHPLGVERRRAETLRRAARRASRLRGADPDLAGRLMRSIPGIGAWTVGEVMAVAFGDTDSVSLGDYHLPHLVAWALAGKARGDDQLMLELLEPFRGHRLRVIRLLESAGLGAPRFGPRRPLRRLERL